MINEEKLYSVVANILGIDVAEISDDTSPDTSERWDSVTHINLIIALEAEFDVELTPEDSMEMLSVKLMKIILTEAKDKMK